MKFKDLLFYLPVYLTYCICKGWISAQNYSQFKSDSKHDAIVIVHEKFAKRCFYGDGIDLLIDFFREKEIPYKVYHCYNLDKFEEIVRNENSVNLWLFGHGRRCGIACGNQLMKYETLKNAHPKRYIYQFHCNPGIETSLAEYLSKGRGYVSNQDNHPVENREHIKQILNDWCEIHGWESYHAPFFKSCFSTASNRRKTLNGEIREDLEKNRFLSTYSQSRREPPERVLEWGLF